MNHGDCDWCVDDIDDYRELFIFENDDQEGRVVRVCAKCFHAAGDDWRQCPECDLYQREQDLAYCLYCGGIQCPRCQHDKKACLQEQIELYRRQPWKAAVMRAEEGWNE